MSPSKHSRSRATAATSPSPTPAPDRARPVVLAVTNDIHAGSTLALCPHEIRLDDGGAYTPSIPQQWLFQCWERYWARVTAVREALNARLFQIFNGDLVEGDHHKTTQILSGNPNAQAKVVDWALTIPLALNPEKIWIVRGTESHVGISGSAEERIAEGLRKDKRPIEGDPITGTASHWHLRLIVNGLRIDVAHHGRTGLREHTRGGAAVLYAHDILLSHVKDGDPYPHLCLRAHHHRFNDSFDAAPVRVVTSGAWQLATSYVHKVAADSLADVGGLIVVINPDGTYTVEKVGFKPKREPVWQELP